MSHEATTLAGILLLGLVTVETGGLYLVSLVRGQVEATPFQMAFARAGHAHAAVLLMLALVYAGAIVLALGLATLGLATLGVGLLRAGSLVC